MEIDHDTKDKKRSELNSTIVRLETEVLTLTWTRSSLTNTCRQLC